MKDATEKAVARVQKLEIRFHIFKMLLMILLTTIAVTILHAQSQRAIDANARQQAQTRAYITCLITITPQTTNPQIAAQACTQKYGN